jgi:N-acetyl-anhydromuramyl-L-alanine amidase AmpD
MRFLHAAHWTPADRSRVLHVVLHSMQAPEKPGRALQVAQWFARPCSKPDCGVCPGPVTSNPGPRASSHYCGDSDEIVQCVAEPDVAWGAPGANKTGIHIELAGYASQTPAQWDDPYSAAMLGRAVDLVVDICRRWQIPPVLAGPSLLRAGEPGITTHAFVTRAFGLSTHTDPGPHFPLDSFIRRVADRL